LEARLERLSCVTLVHAPVKFRVRLAGVMTACLSGLTQGDDYANDLEKLRSKVLYNLPPRGHSLRTELECRLGLWSDGRFEELLLRAEAQSRARLEGRRAKRNGEAARNKALRAKKLAAEGAYRKGVQGLTSSTAELTAEEQTNWANKLLPNTSRVERALSQGQGSGEEADAARPAASTNTGSTGKALDGVRFAALSASGPSGMRPEHLKDALFSRVRGAASRLRTAIAELHAVAAAGELAHCTRWLLDSRLIFLKKKTGPAPRPVRISGVWRKIVCKKPVHETRVEAQKLVLSLRQFGVAVPGGADVLVHFRGALEKALQSSPGMVTAVLDLDLANAFPSLEWDDIRAATEEYMPRLVAWTGWCHQEAANVHLPGGGKQTSDRGAEQGDPLGSVQCVLVIALVMARTRERLSSELGEAAANFGDAWFMDDGQVFCRPELVGDLLSRRQTRRPKRSSDQLRRWLDH